MASLDRYSSTVQKIYAAAADRALWGEALSAIEDFTGSVGAVIDLVPIAGDRPMTFAGRFTAEQCAEYSVNYQHVCRRIAFAKANPHVPILWDSQFITEQEMDRDPVYSWLGKHDLRYFVGGTLLQTDRFVIVNSLQHTPRHGHVQKTEIRTYGLIRGHLAQALTLADRLGTLVPREGGGAAIFDALPHAVFALDSQGRLVLMNERAEELLRAGWCSLRIESGLLRTGRSREQAQLDALIGRSIVPGIERAGGWIRLETAGGGAPLALFVTHARAEELGLASREISVLVMAIDPARPIRPDCDALRTVLGLTSAEVRVATALASGLDLQGTALALQMSLETARSHLKSIFAKAGVHRQQDLLRVLSWLQSGRNG